MLTGYRFRLLPLMFALFVMTLDWYQNFVSAQYLDNKWINITKLGDNCIQNLHLGRYIVGYTFGNLVLLLRLRVAVKLNFRPNIRRYTSQNKNFEYGYPILMHYSIFSSKR